MENDCGSCQASALWGKACRTARHAGRLRFVSVSAQEMLDQHRVEHWGIMPAGR